MRASSKVIGALAIGLMLVAGSFYYSRSNATGQQAVLDSSVAVVTAVAPEREAIEITDSDGDSIPDWKEELRTAEPIQITAPEQTETYEPPDTLTGTVGVDMLKSVLESQYQGDLAASQEDILKDMETKVERVATDELYYEKHVIINQNADIDALREYGNRVAEITALYEKPDHIEHELLWLREAALQKDKEMLNDLDPIIDSLAAMRDAMLRTPVPELMVKEHLDLINTYHALYVNTTAMQEAFDDPMKTIARSKRYVDDAFGLKYALENLYTKLVLQGVTWGPDEPTSSFINITNS